MDKRGEIFVDRHLDPMRDAAEPDALGSDLAAGLTPTDVRHTVIPDGEAVARNLATADVASRFGVRHWRLLLDSVSLGVTMMLNEQIAIERTRKLYTRKD